MLVLWLSPFRYSSSSTVTSTAYRSPFASVYSILAKKFYGSGADYTKIYEANRSVIGGNPSLIYYLVLFYQLDIGKVRRGNSVFHRLAPLSRNGERLPRGS